MLTLWTSSNGRQSNVNVALVTGAHWTRFYVIHNVCHVISVKDWASGGLSLSYDEIVLCPFLRVGQEQLSKYCDEWVASFFRASKVRITGEAMPNLFT